MKKFLKKLTALVNLFNHQHFHPKDGIFHFMEPDLYRAQRMLRQAKGITTLAGMIIVLALAITVFNVMKNSNHN